MLATIGALGCAADGPDPVALREAAYRANNRGIARLEQFDYPAAAAAFRVALATGTTGEEAPGAGSDPAAAAPDDTLPIARLNLALALFYDQDLEGAAREAATAAESLPAALEPPYLLGLVARAENRTDDALDAFEQVIEQDPGDVGTNINLGQIHLEARDYEAAIPRLRLAAAAEPFNVTAVYNLGLAVARSGETDQGRELLQQAQALRASGYAVTYGSGYLEEGRYAEAIASTGAEPDLIDAAPPAVAFAAAPFDLVPAAASVAPAPFGRRYAASDLDADGARALAASLGGGVTPFDADADGDLDLLRVGPEGQQLLRNDGSGAWTDVTEAAGLGAPPPDAIGLGAIAADFDNNLASDLFVLRYGGSSLYRNDGTGRFTDITADAGLAADPTLPGAAAFTDVDHDGDVDLLIAGLADLAATRRRRRNARPVSGRVRPGAAAASAQQPGRHLPGHHRRGRAGVGRPGGCGGPRPTSTTGGTWTCWSSITTPRRGSSRTCATVRSGTSRRRRGSPRSARRRARSGPRRPAT